MALRRTEYRLRQRFDAIDYELDVILPELDEFDRQISRGELPSVTVEN